MKRDTQFGCSLQFLLEHRKCSLFFCNNYTNKDIIKTNIRNETVLIEVNRVLLHRTECRSPKYHCMALLAARVRYTLA